MMIINDQFIIDFFYVNDIINSNKTKLFKLNKIDKSIIEYLDNRYDDSESYIETINRIKYNIETRPVCPICNNKVKWLSKNKYTKYCSYSCRSKDLYQYIKDKSIEYYGTPFNRDKFKKTVINKFGENNWCNNDKRKQTYKLKTSEEFTKINEKKVLTYLQKYNVNNPSQSKSIEEKKDITRILNNNFNHLITSNDSYYNTKDSKLIKYNDENYNNRKKAEQTCLENYGVKNIYNLNKYKQKAHSEESLQKQYNTKKKNNSFNISKPENKSYKLLKEKYKDTIRQYKSEEYPFACDFYIPSLDLYIECNYHWTHGGKLYENTEQDKLILENWKKKNTLYYKQAIITWSIRDVQKYNIAKENNLNYICFYSFNEFLNWLNNINT